MNGYLERGAGVLMPVSSLPSSHGIGTFGKEAYAFVDSLKRASQKYWQVLPLGPTSYGDSPYASFSAFAGNPYFIDLDYLCEEGLLKKEFIEGFNFGSDPEKVDYEALFNSRFEVLREAFKNSSHRDDPEFARFTRENKSWLDDYALYMSCKESFGGLSWQEWDEDIKTRRPAALKRFQSDLAEDIEFWKFVQFKFFCQWHALKAYANENGISIIGDIPIYVALDSADVWANAGFFQLDEKLRPKKIAGVPPDAFSDLGQRWGNPLYDWKELEKDDFKWWRARMKASADLYDVIRIDHFIGIAKYYTIPAKFDDARIGKWVKGPGMKLIKAINESIGDAKIIAEDLGVEVPEAIKLLKKSGYPGMNVLIFAFDGSRDNGHLPFNADPNSVTYGGTHDNETLFGFFSSAQKWQLGYITEYLQAWNDDIGGLIEKLFACAYESVSAVVIFQMQDILKLGNEARMNSPSTLGGNWQWRMKAGAFTDERIERLRYLCDIYGR